MKRLKKINKKTKKTTSRLRKKILAEWTQINPTDSNVIQYLTDAMTYNYPVQINYDGSGWRTIQPYGFNSSKKDNDGNGENLLLMCYKDSGEIRSYRFDKIMDIYIDFDSNGTSISNNDQMNEDIQMENYQQMFDLNQEDYNMPILPEENDNIKENDGIYDEELSILNNDNIYQNNNINNDSNDNIINNNDENIIDENDENNNV